MTTFRQLRQHGFGAAGFIIILLLLVIVVLGGALALKFRDDRAVTPAATSANSSTTNQAPSEATSADDSQNAKIAAHTLDEGNTFVEDTYQQYIQTEAKSQVGAKQGLELIKAKLTPDLYNTISAKYATEGQDDIVCGQALPSTFGVVSNQQSGGSGNYTVNEMFSSATHAVKVTVDLNQLLISAITCPT